VFGEALIGAYLHGSAVLGGLRATSDLDVLIVVSRATTEPERKAITARILEISGRRAYRRPGRPVELTVLVAGNVRPWPFPPRVEMTYGEWLRDDYEAGVIPEPHEMLDLGPEIEITLRGNHVLFGPPPAELLDPMPTAEIRRSIVAGVPSLLAELESDTRNVLLTFARIWFTLETGTVSSKDVAAEWVLERLPGEHRAVLDRARELYLQGADDDWAPVMAAVHAHTDVVVGEIERLSKADRISRSARSGAS
jgi:predicted nucleotidyltransferase